MSRFRLENLDTLTPKQKQVVLRRHQPIEVVSELIGKSVCKTRKGKGKPKTFSHGKRFATIKGVIEHPQSTAYYGFPVYAYTFEEHDTYVACHCVRLYTEDEADRWDSEDRAVLDQIYADFFSEDLEDETFEEVMERNVWKSNKQSVSSPSTDPVKFSPSRDLIMETHGDWSAGKSILGKLRSKPWFVRLLKRLAW